ncbi:MAG: AAA family ATPase [Candidatus Thiosymbion ectosymbiont of Robbea hypermnestra]|nr:AAA family ATPase [Candidatus Thiosymbion ectosymbiont of Robbea hypermnestra]
MKVIGVYNIKGGVGKTATAVNLAYLAAADGNRTLVWDLDPQAAATFYFRVKPKIKGGGKALVRGKRTLDAAVKGTDFENLDLLPADFSFRNLDLALEDAKRPTRRLSRLIEPLSAEYDYLFLDCPPSISLVSENIFLASDAILVPMIPTTLSVRTLEQLLKFLQDHVRLEKPRVMPLFTMVDRRKRLHRELLDRLPEHPAERLDTHIPYASDVEQMGLHRQPLPAYAPAGAAARAYRALWEELERKL